MAAHETATLRAGDSDTRLWVSIGASDTGFFAVNTLSNDDGETLRFDGWHSADGRNWSLVPYRPDTPGNPEADGPDEFGSDYYVREIRPLGDGFLAVGETYPSRPRDPVWIYEP